jgi:hypothetical protein
MKADLYLRNEKKASIFWRITSGFYQEHQPMPGFYMMSILNSEKVAR